MTACWGYLGDGGALVPIKGAQAGLSVSPARPSEDFVSALGVRSAFSAPRAPRTWGITLSPWSDPSLVSRLRLAAQGLLRFGPNGAPSLYTADAAVTNLVPDYLADASSPLAIWPTSGLTIATPTPDGVTPLPSYTRPSSAGSGSRLFPIIPEQEYTLQAATAASGDLYTLRTYGVDATATLQTVTLSSPAGSSDPVMYATTFEAQSDAAWFSLEMATGTAAQISGPRLTEGTVADGFYEAGEGIPLVQVLDPQRVIQSTAGGRVRADFTVTLQEVGL